MGVFVILSLVYKRHREANQRPWRIWLVLIPSASRAHQCCRCFDVSKQVVGQAFVHLLNLLISGLGAHHSKAGKNACVFYFFNVLLDTTLGVYLSLPVRTALTHGQVWP